MRITLPRKQILDQNWRNSTILCLVLDDSVVALDRNIIFLPIKSDTVFPESLQIVAALHSSNVVPIALGSAHPISENLFFTLFQTVLPLLNHL